MSAHIVFGGLADPKLNHCVCVRELRNQLAQAQVRVEELEAENQRLREALRKTYIEVRSLVEVDYEVACRRVAGTLKTASEVMREVAG